MWSSIALITALLTQQTLAQSSTVTIGATGCSGLLADGHCCPGSIIGLGSSNAICCAGDSNLNLINAQGDPNVNIQGGLNGNGMSEGNIMPGPSTCTAGTSTAFNSLPSTASSSTNTASGSTTTTTEGSQVCVTTNDNGDMSKACSGTGAQPSSSSSSGSSSGNGNTSSSGASSGDSSGTSASSSSASSTPSGNAAAKPVPFAGLAAGSLLLGVAML